MDDIKYLENWNKDLEMFDDEQKAIEVHERCIQALKFNVKAKELLGACYSLLEYQDESPCVVNLLEEPIYYNDCECDGKMLLEDIKRLLETGE